MGSRVRVEGKGGVEWVHAWSDMLLGVVERKREDLCRLCDVATT